MWTKKFWQAVAERMIRGAAVTVAGGYFGADVVFDALNVSTWSDVGSLAISGALGSLVLSLAGQALTGNGPALTNNEELTPPVA